MISTTEPRAESVSEGLLTRIKAEYAEMPGLCLTTAQAARLWNVSVRVAEEALRALAERGFLRRRIDGGYRLTSGAFQTCAWFLDR